MTKSSKHKTKGLFLTCEGGEGVGKSTFIQKLLLELKARGIDILGTREPGGSPVAEEIRKIFSHPPAEDTLYPETEFLLISAARFQHVFSKIIPSLESGTWVLCDRFADSTWVYQGILGGLAPNFMSQVIEESTRSLDIHTSFLLDCPVEISLERLGRRSSEGHAKTRYDQASRDHHRKIRNGFLDLAHKYSERFVILDAQKSPEDLVDEALQKLKERKAL